MQHRSSCKQWKHLLLVIIFMLLSISFSLFFHLAWMLWLSLLIHLSCFKFTRNTLKGCCCDFINFNISKSKLSLSIHTLFFYISHESFLFALHTELTEYTQFTEGVQLRWQLFQALQQGYNKHDWRCEPISSSGWKWQHLCHFYG